MRDYTNRAHDCWERLSREKWDIILSKNTFRWGFIMSKFHRIRGLIR